MSYICIYVYIYRTILNCIIWEKTRVNSSTADVGFRFVPLSLSRLFSSPSFYFSSNFIPFALNFISRLRFSYPFFKRMTHSRRVFLELSSRSFINLFFNCRNKTANYSGGSRELFSVPSHLMFHRGHLLLNYCESGTDSLTNYCQFLTS